MKVSGILYGVGIGPGDPELLTLKAVAILKKADVIAVPKSKEEADSRALSIVEKMVDCKGKEILELILPMTKEKEILAKARKEVAALISEKLKQGKVVACITLGDPLFYSTFSYLIPLVMNALPEVTVKIIPGVSSINAASSAALLPLAEADEKIAVIPSTYEQEGLKEIIRGFDTVVLMKVNRVMDKVLTVLEELALKGKATFVSRAGWPEEMVIRDLDSLKGKELDYFSMVIVKK
ncbi:MAG: precorrin-2 C(20)-methyltransferase [Deltaproteobacteria bacterium RIFCSPLOWO2_12_FULL_43_16]|nr:MAG: precorrin-2 C(20)-methyltransferase [Deltaproteobacteria bacterium GWA2_43_19]OGQ11343.1 MAG: precorrin-2 C(20)-methyltransferase [Deltaproteobacteria bacterium RIFCSPHIGHO2_02_FULL_43_33]OGQ43789.1 MAG: precorrin-2 C(20)-methyltransferase [Deltaproteobacteria bacterium RIFCSPLOWO2_01_FULL_42_9]OGQ58977.1 MAG: precorrin-2 C(20)-methyltransferase [Deltaproteobacteria bacterium RIFCSPLOWO2_12_FULL_43_16]HBR17301.1 precorrin-2 C(20)-methyltransferase [Deltaproteobacteria bacterium]